MYSPISSNSSINLEKLYIPTSVSQPGRFSELSVLSNPFLTLILITNASGVTYRKHLVPYSGLRVSNQLFKLLNLISMSTVTNLAFHVRNLQAKSANFSDIVHSAVTSSPKITAYSVKSRTALEQNCVEERLDESR